MNTAELKQHEEAMIDHLLSGVPDGCVCGLCEAVRSVRSTEVRDKLAIMRTYVAEGLPEFDKAYNEAMSLV
jgi:hypothetical protein